MRASIGISRRAFTLIELLVVIAIIAVLVGILLPGLGSARKAARVGVCMGQMQQLGRGTANYGGDTRGSMASFWWNPGDKLSQFPDLNPAGATPFSHSDQAVDIARRRGVKRNQPRITDRLVDRDFTHLLLIDAGYFSERIPEPAVICPEDRATLLWARTGPDGMLALRASGQALNESSNPFEMLMPYASSYQAIPYAWCRDQISGTLTTVQQDPGEHRLYLIPQLPIGGRRLDEVSFPGQKVAYFDLFDRHKYKRTIFYAYPQAAEPLVFFDGSVRVIKTADANPGWNPNTPFSNAPTTYAYNPGFWGPVEPPTLSGAATDTVKGYYRWTKHGLHGVDVGGQEN